MGVFVMDVVWVAVWMLEFVCCQVHKVDFANGKKDTELRKELRRKNEEIAELKSMLSMGKGTVEAVKEQKYLEALKKVKQMTVKLEKEKNSNNKLTRQLVSMEKQLLDVQNLNILPSAGALVSELASVMPGSDEDMQRQFKEAKQKVEKANKVIEHMRRQNQDMTMELKRTKQVHCCPLTSNNNTHVHLCPPTTLQLRTHIHLHAPESTLTPRRCPPTATTIHAYSPACTRPPT